MKDIDSVKVFIVLALILVCFYAGQASNASDLSGWNFLIGFGTILGGLGAIGTMYLAYLAINNWKKQVREQVVIDTAIKLEDEVTKFYLACLDKGEKLKKNPDLKLHKEATLLCLRLRRRDFHTEEVTNLEKSISNVIDSLMDNDFIPDKELDRLLSALNKFSQKF